jgi:hypothetical protein
MICKWRDYRSPENRHHHQERRNHNRTVLKARQCFNSFSTHLELFTWNSSQQEWLQTSTTRRTSFAIYTIQFVVSALSSGAGRTGCCYTTMTQHFTLCLSKRNWQNNTSPFCHASPSSPNLTPCNLFSFPAWKKSYMGANFCQLRRSSLPQVKLYWTFLQISFSSVSSSYTNVDRLA